MGESEKLSEADLGLPTVSSGETIRSDDDVERIAERISAAIDEDAEPTADSEAEMSPVFRELAYPKLPELKRENRARLQMQTPNRVYLYWSLKNNPFQILHRAFGSNTGSYTLIAKLVNETRGTEQIHAIDAEGNWWFSVEPGSTYRAEIGFYAPNRPYFRALYSNSVTTPRRAPSKLAASDADWRIGSDKFAQVLDVAGFKQDAFDVAIAGDNADDSATATYEAISELTERPRSEFTGMDADDIRYALILLAAGATIEELRFRVSDEVFAMLQSAADRLTRDNAVSVLRSHFDIADDETIEEFEESGTAVFGASVVHFPKRVRTRPRVSDKYRPISSHSIR
jgi:hypothetical protein